GNVRFLTVQVSTSEPNVWRVVAAWIDPDRAVEDRNSVQGCLTDAQNQEFNTDLMDQSQNDAKYVALTRLGYSVPADPVQIRIVEGGRDTPAPAALETGDQVLAVDGTNVTTAREIGAAVQAHHPGDRVSITYDRNGVTRTASITAGKVRIEGSGDTATQSCVPARGSTTGTTCLGVS